MSYLVRSFRGLGRWPALALAAALLTGGTHAPEPVGSIEGTVKSQTGAPIAQAQVFIIGTAFNALTDNAGHYLLARVPVGRYTVRAAFVGYKSAEVQGVTVKADSTNHLDIQLEATAVELQEITAVTQSAPFAPRDGSRVLTLQPGATAGVVPRDEVASKQRTGNTATPNPVPSPGHSVGANPLPVTPVPVAPTDGNTENYAAIDEARYQLAQNTPLSTFSIDVDAGSYTNVRRFINDGQRPPVDAVRIEEFLNYFRYDYPEPKGSARFSVTTDLASTPWEPTHRLLRIGIKGKSLQSRAVPPSNLVFLLDVSGSMQPENKLPLVKQAFRLLVQELRAEDRVAIVVYAGAAGLVLPSTPGCDKATILAALDRLEAGGSTAGGAGLRLAYEIARQQYVTSGNNRVILATDGDFNVGESSDAAMVRLIEERRDQGIFLTVLGFGTGNLKDSRMEQIADKGNGNYAYVDNLKEARRIFVREFAGTMFAIAKDVKIQVEFNPARVLAYRLVGYENRALKTEDFADDRKDAGELGAGHTVTALYDVVPVGAAFAGAGLGTDSLRYQQVALRPGMRGSEEWATVQLRYKEPTGTKSRLIAHPVRVKGQVGAPTGDFRFASAVAEFGLVLRNSAFKGAATLDDVISLAQSADGEDPEGDRAEFVRLVESARALGLPSEMPVEE